VYSLDTHIRHKAQRPIRLYLLVLGHSVGLFCLHTRCLLTPNRALLYLLFLSSEPSAATYSVSLLSLSDSLSLSLPPPPPPSLTLPLATTRAVLLVFYLYAEEPVRGSQEKGFAEDLAYEKECLLSKVSMFSVLCLV
jgi:hypothetical protein